MSEIVVRVEDARLVEDGGPAWFVVSHLPDPQAVAEKAASAGGSVSIDDAGRLRALVTPQQLVNAVGRVDATIGTALDGLVQSTVRAWRDAPGTLPAALGVDRAPAVMGIVNVTPDSFSDGGVAYDPSAHPAPAIAHARSQIAAGAAILDIGGESTRPGADPVDADEELRRVLPVIEAVADEVAVSIDTTKADVARQAIAAGAAMVNDVSAGRLDPAMLATVAELDVPYVLMHMQGDPATMQRDPTYDDVVAEVYEFLADGLARAAEAGVARDRIMVDPGIGFGKSLDHNLALLRGLRQFCGLGCPVLVGVSRKSMIGTLTGVGDPGERVHGSVATAALVARAGAAAIRVHDVDATRQALAVATALGQA